MEKLNLQDSQDTATYTEAIYRQNPGTRKRVTDVLTREEIKSLNQSSDFRGTLALISIWGGIVACFLLLGFASTLPYFIAIPLTIIGIALLAGRQLAMGVAVHDASHGTLFKTKWANAKLTNWLCARPLWSDLEKYRVYHFKHHARTAMDDDPDLVLSAGFPTTKGSLARKFLRDLTGQIGIKYLFGRVLMDLEIIAWTMTGEVAWLDRSKKNVFTHLVALVKNSYPVVTCNFLLYLALSTTGFGWLYIYWIVAYVTFHMMYARIRSMAEHGAVEQVADLFLNTRTVNAGWIARLTVAPLSVNYHLEHHVLASCPYYLLPKARKLLLEKGLIEDAPSYADVFRIMSGADARPDNAHFKRFS